jgi:hypothetical protein
MDTLVRELNRQGSQPRPAKALESVQFGEWKPDAAELLASVSNVQDVIPFGPNGYKPMPNFAAESTTAMSARCQGIGAVVDNSDSSYKYAGDATKLYQLLSNDWTDVSGGTTFTISADEWWSFLKDPESNKVLATNLQDGVYSATFGSTFAAHFTSTLRPKARSMAQLRSEFLMVFNVDEDGTKFPDRLRWSSIGDTNDMDASAANQSNSADLGGEWGEGMALYGGDEATAFLERAIYRGVYVGAPTVWDFGSALEQNRGLLAPKASQRVGRHIYYLANDGFFRWNGFQSEPIGDGKVNVEFFDDVETTYYHRITCTYDPKHQVVMWQYTDVTASTSTPTRILLYHWPSGWWGKAHITLDVLFPDLTNYVSPDDMTSISSSLDALEFSLDSSVWQGGRMRAGAVNASRQSGTFSGANLAAIIETGIRQFYPGRHAKITGAYPLVDGGTPTVAVAGARRLNDTFTFETAAAQNTSGKVPLRNKNKFHKLRMNVAAAGSWELATGVQPLGAPADGR